MKRQLKNESGFALILTLVVTALMVAVVVEMIHQVYVDTSISRGFRDGQQASILAESGASGGAKLLQIGVSGRSYTSLSDRWATPLKLVDDAGTLEISVSEESGKININGLVRQNGDFETHTFEALQRLAARLKVPNEVWGAVADWIDGDDLPRSGGAESSYYRSLKPEYTSRNGKVMTLSELSLIRGVSPEILDKLRPYLTPFAEQANAPLPTVNINTASKDVLAALDKGIDDRMAERILEERRLQPFKSIGELSRVPGLDTIATGLGGWITVKGNVFRIVSVAKVGDSGRTVEAVVRLSGGIPEFLSWQEY
jgi:general secretion pathway protein K